MRPPPESVALAKAKPVADYSAHPREWQKWADKMRPLSVGFESCGDAAIRILAAECDALETERDQAQNAAEHSKAFKRVLKQSNVELKSKCDALAKERDEWAEKAAQLSAERESNAMQSLAYKAERDALLKLCHTARVVMMGDTKHDGGDVESDWIQDFDDLYAEITKGKESDHE